MPNRTKINTYIHANTCISESMTGSASSCNLTGGGRIHFRNRQRYNSVASRKTTGLMMMIMMVVLLLSVCACCVLCLAGDATGAVASTAIGISRNSEDFLQHCCHLLPASRTEEPTAEVARRIKPQDEKTRKAEAARDLLLIQVTTLLGMGMGTGMGMIMCCGLGYSVWRECYCSWPCSGDEFFCEICLEFFVSFVLTHTHIHTHTHTYTYTHTHTHTHISVSIPPSTACMLKTYFRQYPIWPPPGLRLKKQRQRQI